jgi:hypothetical protein
VTGIASAVRSGLASESSFASIARPERWARPIGVGLIVLNVILVARLLTWTEWHTSPDWQIWARLPAFGSGISPYLAEPLFRYSPVAAWLIQPLAVLIGPIGFVLLHFAVLLTLPRRLGLIVAVSFPFWFDLMWGNTFTFVFVAAFWAIRANKLGIVGYVVLTMLMPRPVQLPLLAWLLWRHDWLRLPVLAFFVAHLMVVLWSGFGADWLSRLLESSSNEMSYAYNFGPTRFFGYAWLVVGLPLGVWLWRRHPAWAGLAIAPYLLGQYWLLVFADRTAFQGILGRELALDRRKAPR